MAMKGRNLGYGLPNGGMIRNQLVSIMRASEQLFSALEDADDLPDWVLTKIATSMDRLITANNYILSKLEKRRMNPKNMNDKKLEQVCEDACELAVIIRLNGW